MTICGIDPGINGGLAFIDETGYIIHLTSIPTISEKKRKRIDIFSLKKLLLEYKPSIVVLEEVHAFPKQGTVSMFRFGEAFGLIIGLCYGLDIKVITISCRQWQKCFGLSGDKKGVVWKAQLENPKHQFNEHTASAFFIAKWYCNKELKHESV